jgi:hypothetical protein
VAAGGEADAAVVTAASSPAAAVIKIAARWVCLMMSCLLAGQAGGISTADPVAGRM